MIPGADRPRMPGYGVLAADEGAGLLPWSWAAERLARSHDYWVATRWPDGRPHLSPVWGVWRGGALEWSCSARSRKALNLAADPRCSAATADPDEPVVVDGTVEAITARDELEAFTAAADEKYGGRYGAVALDPATTAFRLRPATVIALQEADFTGTPTRWRFD